MQRVTYDVIAVLLIDLNKRFGLTSSVMSTNMVECLSSFYPHGMGCTLPIKYCIACAEARKVFTQPSEPINFTLL